MSSRSPDPEAIRRVRPKLFWRLLFLLVCLLAAFLYAGFMSLGGYLLMLGLDQEHPEPQRVLALGGGASILLLGLWLLKVAMPRRLVPTVVEREH
ncbi:MULTISPECIES: hypothetical protein [unclassified Pseudomonas]|uniref:hypothetical protein n=1 Tax=unclassified Pseudomonas TaxID=196821 RepID=UPI0019415FA9|nr:MULTISPECIES: hypothetical protein [unclassified Pseudomonas]MCE0914668.1 hypothetical protein [Pseudomonas sp. NMI760_13]MCP8633370.1 hypothetical protein [Pseudomonas sp. DVZ6]MDC0689106.1 hypothetical protein [Mitsuaria sp. RG]MDD7782875.1 hypothetical protein [Pseudomonas sp. DVZ24]